MALKNLLTLCSIHWFFQAPAVCIIFVYFLILLEMFSQLENNELVQGEPRARGGGFFRLQVAGVSEISRREFDE